MNGLTKFEHIDSKYLTKEHKDVTYEPLPTGIAPGKGVSDFILGVQANRKFKNRPSVSEEFDRIFFVDESKITPAYEFRCNGSYVYSNGTIPFVTKNKASLLGTLEAFFKKLFSLKTKDTQKVLSSIETPQTHLETTSDTPMLQA